MRIVVGGVDLGHNDCADPADGHVPDGAMVGANFAVAQAFSAAPPTLHFAVHAHSITARLIFNKIMRIVLTYNYYFDNVDSLAHGQVKRIMMKRIQKLALAVGIAATAHFHIAAAAVPLSFAPGYEACYRNCPQISQVGNTLVVTLLDKAGKPFKVVTTNIDQSATKAVVSASAESPALPTLTGATAMSGGEITMATRHTTVQTATETVVYTLVAYYQNGVLIDVKVTEQRFPREKQK